MKKHLFFLALACILLSACPPLPQYQIDEINYQAKTRGHSESILLKKSMSNHMRAELIHKKNGKEISRRNLKNKDFKKLISILKNVNLKSIDKLSIPSKKHQFDGAMVATIEIISKGNTYTSTSFDHDNPPKELKPLLDYLKALVK